MESEISWTTVAVHKTTMSGIKRKIEDNDPDYEDVSQVHENKRNKLVEQNGNHLAFSLLSPNQIHNFDI